MENYRFTEATPFINFLYEKILGRTLKKFHIDYWPSKAGGSSTCSSFILELDEYCVAMYYGLTSHVEASVGSRTEMKQERFLKDIIDIRDDIINYFDEEFHPVEPELIDGHMIEKVFIKHISKGFEINASTGERCPDGGDYFSIVKLGLDNNISLCFCGASSICDGYMDVWCELTDY